MSPDLVNGLFELGGAGLLCLNVKAIWRDRSLKGAHWGPTVFFTVWGFWNLAYYPMLDQWFSFAGGVAIVIVNCVWLASLGIFSMREAMEVLRSER